MKNIFYQIKETIQKEQKLGFTNAAVFGGFSAFLIQLADRMLKETGDAGAAEKLMLLKELALSYREQPVAGRRGVLEEISRAVEGIDFSPIEEGSKNQQHTQPSRLDTPVQFLKNVGPKRASLFHKIGVRTVGDLLEYYPKRYEDRRFLKKISQLQPGEKETVRGWVIEWEELKPRPGLVILKAWVKDETGIVPAVWFNQQYVKKQLPPGSEIIIHGRVEKKYLQPEMLVQDFEIAETNDLLSGARIVPVYGTTERLPQKVFRKIAYFSVERFGGLVPEFLPERFLEKYRLPKRGDAVRSMHFPQSPEEQKRARFRMAFEELLLLQLGILAGRPREKAEGISHLKDASIPDEFFQVLPFALTGAQKRVIEEIYRDMERDFPMARLVQGDVGSGKTVVAAAALYKAVRSGFQGALMAPTEILAEQHFSSISFLMGRLNVRVALLTGRTTAKEREKLSRALLAGEIDVLVGTHALIQKDLAFHALSLAVTDEQHRFGVMQRAALQGKGKNPDVLVMTATPIPRSLALTLYGDLNLSVIDEMPPGRKEIKTYAVDYSMEKRILAFIKKEVKKGRQVYVVCPLVEESEKIDLQAAAELAERLEREFKDMFVALLHGRMKSKEKEQVMEDFRAGKVQLLVSTTVIEVGINVPNATVMLIRDAERFGLAQLHQLRGRIGRGSFQSYCILMHNAKSNEARERMKIMESTGDGFKIAEADLSLRGPGDFFGTRQHGLPELKVANIFDDAALMETARKEALDILKDDPGLSSSDNEKLGQYVKKKFKVIN